MNVEKAEAVILGGGPAGATAAYSLARRGSRVLVIDRRAPTSRPPRPRVGEALPPAARPLLSDLGLLDLVQNGGHRRCVGNVSIWGKPTPTAHDFLRDPQGPGWHLDRRRFDEDLRGAAAEAGATVAAARTVATERTDRGWTVRWLTMEGEERQARCRWMIDATGRGSVFARRLGCVRQRDDRLVAFVAHFRPTGDVDPDRDARTWIEAAPDGWWYMAPLPSGHRVVACQTDYDLVDRPALRTRAGFLRHLDQAPNLQTLLSDGGYTLDTSPRGVDACSGRLDRVAGEGWLAVGDAAISFDPLSSQGLLNALYTGLRGAEAVHAALTGKLDGPADYTARIEDIYRAYLSHRAIYYAAEGRWPNRPFWARRLAKRQAMAQLF